MLTEIFKALFLTSCMGALLTLVLALFEPITKKHFSSRWHYYIWLVVLIVMVLPIRIDLPKKMQAQQIFAFELDVHDIIINDNTAMDIQNEVMQNVEAGQTALTVFKILSNFIEDKINMCLAGIKRGQQTLSNTFNNVYYAFFAKPLLKKGIETLSNTKHDMRGVPEMDARSIDFILNRGRCICGRCLKTDEEAIKAILYEKSLLPPHEIGSTIRATIDSAKLILDDSKDHYGQIKDAFAEICKQERMLDDTRIDLQNVVDKIKKVGNVNIAELEDDYQKANKILNNLNQKKGRIKGEIAFIEAEIDSLNKKINSLVISNEKNRLIERAVACATEVYNWFKTEYDRSIADVKARLTIKINETFNEMYHGERVVEIDDDYRIKLLAPIGGNRFKTDESKGLEAVKNFSFICGLVALAREKAVLQSSNNELEKERAAEPYPIVMDAPFSNVDEIHIRNISKILPSVAE